MSECLPAVVLCAAMGHTARFQAAVAALDGEAKGVLLNLTAQALCRCGACPGLLCFFGMRLCMPCFYLVWG